MERTPRPVTLHSIMLAGSPAPNEYILNIHCSKGTYVRVLLEDIGRALGVPATMAALRRTASGPYTLEMAYTLDELQRAREAGTLESLLLSVESVFHLLPARRRGERGDAPPPAEWCAYLPVPGPGRALPRAVRGGISGGVPGGKAHPHPRKKTVLRTRVTRPAGAAARGVRFWGLLSRAGKCPH